jgi:hypothetical protein
MFAMVFAFQLARQGGNERKKAAPGLGRMSRANPGAAKGKETCPGEEKQRTPGTTFPSKKKRTLFRQKTGNSSEVFCCLE